MPTYQYVCTNPEDKHEFEVVQSFSDPSLTECPQCGNPVRKVYGSVGVVFKGSGFYRTDSRAAAKSGDGDSSNGSSPPKKESPGEPSGGAKKSTDSGGPSTGGTTTGSKTTSGSTPA